MAFDRLAFPAKNSRNWYGSWQGQLLFDFQWGSIYFFHKGYSISFLGNCIISKPFLPVISKTHNQKTYVDSSTDIEEICAVLPTGYRWIPKHHQNDQSEHLSIFKRPVKPLLDPEICAHVISLKDLRRWPSGTANISIDKRPCPRFQTHVEHPLMRRVGPCR